MSDNIEFRITKVEKQKRNPHRYNIFINDEFSFSAHEDILIKYNLWKDRTIQLSETEQAIMEDEHHRVYMDAIRYLSRRRHSAKELKDKLLGKGYESNVCDTTIIKLKAQDFINDSEFAHAWTEQRLFSQRKGKQWIRKELAHKGIAKEQIAEALDQVSPEDERTAARQLVGKKWGHLEEEQKGQLEVRRKMMGFLVRRGFSMEVINEVVREKTGQDNEEWDYS